MRGLSFWRGGQFFRGVSFRGGGVSIKTEVYLRGGGGVIGRKRIAQEYPLSKNFFRIFFDSFHLSV